MRNWAIDNGVVTNVLFDEYSGVGGNRTLAGLKKAANYTISRPDQFVRVPIFMSFAGLLERSGKFPTKEAAWLRAAEITDHVVVSMKNSDRPSAIDKLGPAGDIGYVFKAPVVNAYNTISIMGKEKNKLPLATYLLSTAIMSGIGGSFAMGEIEGIFDVIKEIFSTADPAVYDKIKDISVKEFMLKNFDDSSFMGKVLNWGLPSAVTDINFAGRFNQQVLDVEHPLSNLVPLAGKYSDWAGAVAGLAGSPTNPNKQAEAAYKLSPPMVAGIVETTMPQFKTMIQPDDGTTMYKNPRDPSNSAGFVQRNEQDELTRKMGMVSLPEASRKTKDIIERKHAGRDVKATKAALDRLVESIMSDRDSAKIQRDVALYSKLDPTMANLKTELESMILKSGMTQQQFMETKAKTLAPVLSVIRRTRWVTNPSHIE